MEAPDSVQLVVGAEGMVGRALVRQLQVAGHRVLETVLDREPLGPGRLHLNLAEPVATWEPPRSVSTAILCAAITNAEACRLDPDGTARVNIHGITSLAGTLAARGAFLVFLSSNHVFDGRRPDMPAESPYSPGTEYGRQKAEAERLLLAFGDQVAVVRFTKLLSPELPLFAGWIKALKAGQVVHPFSDMRLAPVPLTFAVTVLQRIVETHQPGVLQVSAAADITYEQAARHLAERLNADSRLVQPIRAADRGIHAGLVPPHTTLDTARLRRTFGLTPPDVWSAVDAVLSP